MSKASTKIAAHAKQRDRRAPRATIAAGTALATTALTPATADGELIQACAAFCALERAANATFRGQEMDSPEEAAAEAERARIYKEQAPLIERILEAPCVTVAGFRAMAEALTTEDLELLKPGPGDRAELFTIKLVKSLLAMPAADQDAELIRLAAEHTALERQLRAIYDGPDAIKSDARANAAAAPINARQGTVIQQMNALQAATPTGIQARAHCLAVYAGHFGYCFDKGAGPAHTTLAALFRDALALGQSAPAPNPDAELLALRPKFEELRDAVEAVERLDSSAPDFDHEEHWKDVERTGDAFDKLCVEIVRMPVAQTEEGRSLKAIAAMHQLAYVAGRNDTIASGDAGSGPWAAWYALSEVVAGRYPLPQEHAA